MPASPLRADTLSQSDIISFFSSPDTHRGQEVKRIDTHANIAFLVGYDAYKMKRDVKFPFLDYSSLAKRKAACDAEIRLNSQYAPQIYRSTLPITLEANGNLELNGRGEVVEWLVHMNRFDEHLGLDKIADRDGIPSDLAQDLAHLMLRAHKRTTLRDAQPWIDDLMSYVNQNLEAFLEFPELFPKEDVMVLDMAARKELAHITPIIQRRGADGLVRLNHGDAHLANIVMHDGKPLLFDAIEFDDAIATGDVLYDLAFLLLDLCERKELGAANVVFNTYLQLSHDTRHLRDLRIMRFYMMMRAAIRAKISAASLQHQEGRLREKTRQQAIKYFQISQKSIAPVAPVLFAIGGFSGTGKTTLARGLAPLLGHIPGAVHLRTDIIRKELLHLPTTEKAEATTYTQEFSEHVYKDLQERAAHILKAGHSVIVDGVYAKAKERDSLEQLAQRNNSEFQGIWLHSDLNTLINRVEARHGDASDANAEVVKLQHTYDTGPVAWPTLDASVSIESVLKQACSLTGLDRSF